MNIDWSKVVLNLRTQFPLNYVSRKVKADVRSLGRLSRGEIKEPKFSQGLALLDLHLDACPDRHKEVLR